MFPVGNLKDVQLRPGSLSPQMAYEQRELLPEGEYQAVIVQSEARVSRANNRYVRLTFCVIDGPYKERVVYANVNITNHNEWAMQMGHAHLQAICKALDMSLPNDTSAFHFRPLTIRVRHRLRKDTGRNVAEVVDYAPPNPQVAERYRTMLTDPRPANGQVSTLPSVAPPPPAPQHWPNPHVPQAQQAWSDWAQKS